MESVLPLLPPPKKTFPPSDIVTVKIDPVTGLLASEQQTNAINELFLINTAPKTYSSIMGHHTKQSDQSEDQSVSRVKKSLGWEELF